MRKFQINVNGTSYQVEVEELGGTQSVAVPTPAAAPAPAPAAPAVNAAGEKVEAPMPGTILDIKVSAGQQVAEGDIIVILEALKMENEILAPCAGTVSAINVSKGATVNTGDTIAIIG